MNALAEPAAIKSYEIFIFRAADRPDHARQRRACSPQTTTQPQSARRMFRRRHRAGDRLVRSPLTARVNEFFVVLVIREIFVTEQY
jgi:hypothetical protein